MANYLVASGSRKISQLEIATTPIPGNEEVSSSAMVLLIGDTFPATNATTVQIQTRNFIDNLVFDESGIYTGNNTLSGDNTLSGNNTFNGDNTFSGENSFNTTSTLFNNQRTSVNYQTIVEGANIEMFNFTGNDSLRIRVDNGNGVQFDDYNGTSYDTFLKVGTDQGRIDILRETHFSQNVVITGSLTALEIFTTYETASILYSSGSTKFGDTMDDIHSFTGSVKLSGSIEIVNGGTIDGVDISVFKSNIDAETASLQLQITQTSQSLSLLSGSFLTDSGSFQSRITQTSQSLSLLSGSYETTSASLSTRVTSLSTASGSFSTRVSDLENFSSSQYNTDSQSFEDRVTENSQSLSLLSGSYETTSASLSTRVTQNTGDISILSASFETTSSKLISASGSFSTRVTSVEGSVSGLTTDSSSFQGRITSIESFTSSIDTTIKTKLNAEGVISSSQQVNADTVTNFDANVLAYNNSLGIISSSQQVNADSITNFDPNVLTYINSKAVVSSSQQINADNVTNFDTNVLAYNNSLGVVSGSQQILDLVSIDEDNMSSNSDTKLPTQQSVKQYVDGISGSLSTRVTNNELTGSDHEDRIVKGINAVTSSAVSSSLIKFDVLTDATAPAYEEGVLYYNQEQGALSFYNDEADITLQIGQEFYKRVKNQSGDDILDGTPVRISGSQGDMALIWPATAEDHTTSNGITFENHIIGIATHDILDTETGYITELGVVRGIDTQNFAAGDILYLQTGSPVTVEDYYRNTPPPFPYDIIQVGYVVRSAANGFIEVSSKEPIHFGNISGLSGSSNPEVGDLWVYQSNNGYATTHELSGSYTINSGSLTVGGDILPGTNEVYDLGSPSQRWRDLYLSGSTIDLGGLLIQRNSDGNVQFIDSASQEVKTVSLQSATDNILIGDNAGNQLTTGTDNVLIGKGAGANIAAASVGNTALGSSIWSYSSASPKDIGNWNIAIGYYSQERKEEGAENTSVGVSTLRFNYSGSGNTTFGYQSLSGIATFSDYNTAIGHRAGHSLVGGNRNIFIGAGATSGPTNNYSNMIVIGSGSVGNASNTTTIGNDEITHTYIRGLISGSSIETGDILVTNEVSSSTINVSDSVYVRNSITASKLLLDTFGNNTNNISIGLDAHQDLSIGADDNIAIGHLAGATLTTGDSNVAIGYQALGFGASSLTGNHNTAIGATALRLLAASGGNNTAIGYGAGNNITSGSSNVIIGYLADTLNVGDSNSIVIGSNVTGNGSNTITIGGALNTTTYFGAETVKITDTTASGPVKLVLHNDTDSDPVVQIDLQRGASDTWGGDAYRDWRIQNDGGEFGVLRRESGDPSGGVSVMVVDTSNRINFQTGSYDITTKGVTIDANSRVLITTQDNLEPLLLNRQDSDGVLIEFRQANTVEGSIEVSGATVTLNGFAGAHESSGISTDSPIGTVVSTIDELDTREIDGVTQTINNHPKIKVSDVVGDSRIYGVVGNYNPKTGKPQITAVGIGSVLVTGPCNGGDLLESNGDGTAKVQSDDIIRSKTIGKVTVGDSNSGVKLVSCVLYCG